MFVRRNPENWTILNVNLHVKRVLVEVMVAVLERVKMTKYHLCAEDSISVLLTIDY